LASVLPQATGEQTMGQEVSISYQAVKSKVYKLIDALVEDAKTRGDVQDSVKRWWKLVHPADRPVARKYLMMVLEKSNASLEAISDGLLQFAEGQPEPAKLPKLHTSVTDQAQVQSRI
jgi:hypothetical protein